MADFGWAFVKGGLVSGSAPPSGAVQFNNNGNFAGSPDLVFTSGSTSQLNLTGTLNVSGAINANLLNITVTEQNVVNISSTGSTKFGDTSDDLHQFTGSLSLAGNLSASVNISASAFYGDGSNLTGISANPGGSTTQIQLNNAGAFGGSSDLTFASNVLAVTGTISASSNISASAFYGDGSNLTGITTSPAGADTQIQFNNSNNFGGSSNFVFDNGKVGIGTDTPSTLLHVKSTEASKPILKIENQQGGANPVSIQMVRDTNTPADDDAIGQIDFRSKNSVDTEKLYAYITGKSTDVTDGTEDGEIQLYTMANGVLVPVMTLQSGKVGIGSQDPNHKLTVIGDISASVNVSASAFYGDGSNLTGIATTLDAVTNNGNTTTNAMTASALNLTGLAAGTATNTNFLALDSNNNVVLTSSNGGNSTMIGEAEDGSYADGLFSDFTTSTLIGTAIDKFNEILKIIVPGPAPAVDRINYTNPSGIETKLTFETPVQATGTGYSVVDSTGSFTSPPGIDDQYTVATSGEDFRLGVYDGTQEITGAVNFHIVEELKTSEVNYSHDAFGNAESGSLNLIVNGATIHTLNLTASGAGNPNTGSASDVNSDGSGFINLSITASATDQNGSTYDIFQHRTTDYTIHPDDQRKGWNYAKVEHVYGSTTYITNFIQWFNDTDASSQAMSISNQRATFTGQGSKYLSGVEYFRSASITYNAEVSNAYKYTYPTGNVLTFNRTTNIDTISAQALQATDGTDLFNKVFEITGSTNTNDNTMLDDSATISINLTHPLKTNLSTAGAVTTDEILIYHRDTSNSNIIENFELEDYRLTNNTYLGQAAVAGATWNSQNHMTSSGASGHTDGLVFYNSRLYSPKQGANGGDFSSLANAPAGNPDYSSVTGTRTFFRKLQNTTGNSVYDLKITSTKNTKINNTTLTTDNVKFFVKIPGTTGWMDISQNFSYGNIGDNDGALINGASDNSNAGTSSTLDSVHCVTFGTASVASGDHVVIKIEADASWTKYFETLQFQLGASDVSDPIAAPTLDDIDLNNSGVTAKLSFGSSNGVSGYTNVEGAGTGSMSDIDSNGSYSLSGDRRGIFSPSETMTGDLNEDVGSSGQNYTSNSFYNAYSGSLALIVNGVTASTLDLESTRNAINNISSNTGFSVSALSFSKTSDLIPDYNKPYRTGTYSIGTSIQNDGWNYARVVHITNSEQETNYVEWVVDPSGSVDDTNVSTGALTRFYGDSNDYYYQSGIGYFTSDSYPTASVTFTGSNFYSNVYYDGSDGVSFPTTTYATVYNLRITGSGITTFDSSTNQAAMPALNNSADCEAQSIEITGGVTYTGGTSIYDSNLSLFTSKALSVKGRVKHVTGLKSNRDTNTLTSGLFMFYSGTIGSTTLTGLETFGLETYRIVSGNYANQAALTSSSNTWDSTAHINNGGAHDDGMVTANGYLISPFNIGDDGDTRSAADGGITALEAPSGNPDYSTLTENIRTYYRLFRYTGVTTLSSFSMSIEGDATLVSKDSGSPYYAALGANKNCTIELKVSYDPNYSGADDQSTGWTDIAKIFDAGNQPNNDGAGIRVGASSGEDVTIDGDGLDLSLTLGTRRIKQNQYYVVKVSAHKDWTGYISEIGVTY